ncbi:Uncharacterised protein [Mycobacteroides abscessus subsp. abscessus]|uniref:hypothetical protein n=1 Tax=Mycobacteroides abscessus TaxID=36809 RepID=UPI000928FCD8|nr:hypothetical protein [Mycobacteroides abscessus]SIJ20366.1 Uncharacterised protein [Mycobacteroides abscessus subsp. abscessus]SLH39828.1 Uncharacterised protein [Mycobacteroides abscessus subsp. abscessus]
MLQPHSNSQYGNRNRHTSKGVRLTIRVENAYSDGHTSELVQPAYVDQYTDDESLWEALYCHTGDGHGKDRDVNAYYKVTILESPDSPDLVGLSNEWV